MATKPNTNPNIKQQAKVYDKQGVLQDGAYVVNGQTYLADGQRVKPGMVVNINGKTFRMDDDSNPNNNSITADDFNNIASLREKKIVTEGAGGVSDNPVAVTYPDAPVGGQLTKDYGITQDRAELEKLLSGAVDAKYAQLGTAHKRMQNSYYDTMAATQDTVLGTLRKNNINAITTGASKGVQAANELAAVLGLSQAGAQGATQLATAEQDLALNHATEKAMAKTQALTDSNELGKALAQIGSTFYNADVIRYGSELNHNAAMDANLAGLLAQKYASDQALKGQQSASAAQIAAAKTAAAAAAAGQSTYQPQVNPLEEIFKGMSKEQQQAYFIALSSGDWTDYKKLYGAVPAVPKKEPSVPTVLTGEASGPLDMRPESIWGLLGAGNKMLQGLSEADLWKLGMFLQNFPFLGN